MKRKICKCLFICLLFVSAAIFNIQVHANVESEELYYGIFLPEEKDGIHIIEFMEGIGESRFVSFLGFEEKDIESLSVKIKDKKLVKLGEIEKTWFEAIPLGVGKTTLTVTLKLNKEIQGKKVWKWTVNTVLEKKYASGYVDSSDGTDSSSKKTKKSKVSMPKSIKSGYSDADGYCFPNMLSYNISYDKSGRIKKITAVSQSTGSKWNYTISYKSSGKNIKATVKCKLNGGESSQKYTYKFNSEGRLISSRDSSFEWGYADENEFFPMMVADNYACVFEDNGPLSTYELKDGKVISFDQFYYIKGQLAEKECYCFDEPVSLEKALNTDNNDDMYLYTYTYDVKTKKVSMTEAVRWMNIFLLHDFVYQ